MAQPRQQMFLSSTADIAIFGGGAGGGKTLALLLEPLYHVSVKGFGAVTFRRTTQQLRGEGGLWDAAAKVYSRLPGAEPRESDLEWRFAPHKTRHKFSHMEHVKDRFNWDSTEVPLIQFDQLESFDPVQFWHMLSRNRSTCGVAPYIRASCNPDPDSFVASLIDWWIDDEGFPIEERSGIKRWFVRVGDDLVWADDKEAAIRGAVQDYGLPQREVFPLSLTFIPSLIDDNAALLKADPGYLAKLAALPRVERERLRRGNWKIRPAAGMYFKRSWFGEQLLDRSPEGAIRRIRQWDLAGTEPTSATPNPDWTAGALMSLLDRQTGHACIEHCVFMRGSPGKVEERVLATAREDGPTVEIGITQDPGQAGRAQATSLENKLRQELSGVRISVLRETGAKETRASPLSAAAEHAKISVVRGHWVDQMMDQLENFPVGKDDAVDALANAYNELTGKGYVPLVWGRP